VLVPRHPAGQHEERDHPERAAHVAQQLDAGGSGVDVVGENQVDDRPFEARERLVMRSRFQERDLEPLLGRGAAEAQLEDLTDLTVVIDQKDSLHFFLHRFFQTRAILQASMRIVKGDLFKY
jgi:hypothetical protein